MITHIVLWKLKDQQEVPAVKEQLASLPDRVPGILRFVVGTPPEPTDPMVDISLYSEFASWDDLRAYQVHPEHQKVVAFLKTRVAERKVSDYVS